MKITFEEINFRKADYGGEIIITFNNDRHHLLGFSKMDTPAQVANKLRLLADFIERDHHLQEYLE